MKKKKKPDGIEIKMENDTVMNDRTSEGAGGKVSGGRNARRVENEGDRRSRSPEIGKNECGIKSAGQLIRKFS